MCFGPLCSKQNFTFWNAAFKGRFFFQGHIGLSLFFPIEVKIFLFCRYYMGRNRKQNKFFQILLQKWILSFFQAKKYQIGNHHLSMILIYSERSKIPLCFLHTRALFRSFKDKDLIQEWVVKMIAWSKWAGSSSTLKNEHVKWQDCVTSRLIYTGQEGV